MAAQLTARHAPGNPQSALARVNLILFEAAETTAPLPRTDLRAVHILAVLRREVGGTFDCGLINGPRGKGTLAAIDDTALTLRFAWDTSPPPAPAPITLVLGLPRPQTARDILRDATSLGVAAMHFVTTEKGDANYARSTLWSSGEWRRYLVLGAEQAFDTHLPTVTHGQKIQDVITRLPAGAAKLALDNYESPQALSAVTLPAPSPVAVALGPERGWSAAERTLLRASGFTFVHLGSRVLRAETATLAAVTLVRAKLNLM